MNCIMVVLGSAKIDHAHKLLVGILAKRSKKPADQRALVSVHVAEFIASQKLSSQASIFSFFSRRVRM